MGVGAQGGVTGEQSRRREGKTDGQRGEKETDGEGGHIERDIT